MADSGEGAELETDAAQWSEWRAALRCAALRWRCRTRISARGGGVESRGLTNSRGRHTNDRTVIVSQPARNCQRLCSHSSRSSRARVGSP